MKTLDKQNIWMIENWEKLHRLESTMIQTRENYTNMFEEIHNVVKRRHPTLNRLEIHLSPKDIRNYGGQVAFSSAKWPFRYNRWPTGIYVCAVSLDELSGEKRIEPEICICIGEGTGKNKGDERVEILRSRLSKKAKKLFAGKNLQWRSNDDDNDRICLIYPLPEDRSKLIELLIKKEGKGFIDCMASHVSRMAAFIPIIDEVLTK